MKNLIDYINESQSESSISNWIAKVVNKGVNGIPLRDKDKCLKDFSNFALENCKNLSQSEIGEMLESQQAIYVIIQPMDNKYLSFSFVSDEFRIFLSPAYASVKESSDLNKQAAVDFAFMLPYEETLDILSNVKWPDERIFTNVSDKDEFIDELNKYLK